MKLVFIIIISVFFVQEPSSTSVQLEDFVFSQEVLPDGCSLKVVASNDRLPCQAKSNPFISSERSFLDCFTKRLIQDPTLVQQVNRGLFSVYEAKSEMGIFGLATDSETTTELILKDIQTNHPDDESMELFQSGNILIWLWHDQGKTNAFSELKTLINARIK